MCFRICGYPGRNFCYNVAGWHFSLKLMRSRFFLLLTPVVFMARLSSGSLKRKKGEQREAERGAFEIYNPSDPPPDIVSHAFTLPLSRTCTWAGTGAV